MGPSRRNVGTTHTTLISFLPVSLLCEAYQAFASLTHNFFVYVYSPQGKAPERNYDRDHTGGRYGNAIPGKGTHSQVWRDLVTH